LQEQLDKINEYVDSIPNNYKKTEECAFLIRSALALSIHVFYYKKYGMSVDIPSSLNDAIKDARFKNSFFDKMMIISDIQSIRIFCNGIIHPTTTFNAKYNEQNMAELYERLIKCIKVIEDKANIKIINNNCTIFTPKIIPKGSISIDDDKKAKEVFNKTGLVENKVLSIKGIRKFVEKYFNQSAGVTQSIMASRWIIPWFDKEIVWVVEMVKTKPLSQRNDWVNVYNGDEIIEIMPKGKNTFGITPVKQYAQEHPYRIAVEKITNGMIVHGVYKFDEEKTKNNIEHYYTKI